MKRRAALIIAIALLCASCSGMLEQEYQVIAPHIDTPPNASAQPGGAFRASNYAELKTAILRVVRGGDATIRLRGYNGDPESDVQRACRSVLNEEPIGAYALDFLNYGIVPMMMDYEVTVSLSRRRSIQQISEIKTVSGPSEFRERLDALLSGIETEFTVETNYYQETSYEISDMLRTLYDSKPLRAQGFPEMSVSLYPDSGLRRIIELKLSYPLIETERLRREQLCQQEAERLSKPGASPSSLYDALFELCEFDDEQYAVLQSGDPDVRATIYDALVTRRALPESFALAYKALCDAAGVPCKVVHGRRGPDEHVWNMIEVDGDWYHVDVGADRKGGTLTHDWFLLSDERMPDDYRWDTAKYPAAVGDLTYEDFA